MLLTVSYLDWDATLVANGDIVHIVKSPGPIISCSHPVHTIPQPVKSKRRAPDMWGEDGKARALFN